MTRFKPHKPIRVSGPLKFNYCVEGTLKANIESLLATVHGKKNLKTGESHIMTMMSHLVAAMLAMALHRNCINFTAEPVDQIFRRGNTIIHITDRPDWPLLHQCFAESDDGLRPLVISSRTGAAQAEALAQEVGMGGKVEVLDITQFLVSSMLDWTAFDGSKRRYTFEELIARYNVIVDASETDPSLKIEVA